MAKKKRTNPRRVPISPKKIDTESIVMEATRGMTLRAWLLILGSLADFYDTTTDMMIKLWHDVNKYSEGIRNYADIEPELQRTEEIIERKLPWETVSSSNLRTQGDLDKFRKKLHQNAMHAAFVLIAHPIIHGEFVATTHAKEIFQHAYKLDEEIYEGYLSIQAIQEALKDEFGIMVYEDEHGSTKMSILAQTPAKQD